MQSYEWYQQLAKPSWAPPSWLFGPVWTILYLLIAISFFKVFQLTYQKQLSLIVALPFTINIISNLVFTPLQFGLKNNYLATIDILIVLGSLIWAMIAIYPHQRWISFIQIPYLVWVCFASILQITITYLNR